MHAARVTVVVPCVCVCVCVCMCVCVRSFLPPCASRPRNIGTYVFTTQEVLYCANSLSRLRLRIACFISALHKKEYHIGWIFRYT